ncbi:MAG: sugar phosphate isomerase/epimerase [Phycisphaerales bacterium]|nr:sugar phosphate isomerase/epimerase [Phycisphaerales bacterium]
MIDAGLSMFSKHLQGIPLEQAAGWVREIGITSLDLTVRRGGHVEPERVEEDLPRVAEQLTAAGLRIAMITTEICDVNEPATESILKTAAALGISHYKVGYFRYAGFGTLRAQRAEVAAKLKELGDLSVSLGVVGGYHNHSDDFFGANLADLDDALQYVDPRGIGVYFDPAHATIEGGSRGWLMALDRIAPRLVMLAVKDFRWVEGKHRSGGGRRHSAEWCPLAEGNTPWPEVLTVLKQANFNGPISFHSEYQGKNSFRNLSVPEVVQQTAADIRRYRDWLAAD